MILVSQVNFFMYKSYYLSNLDLSNLRFEILICNILLWVCGLYFFMLYESSLIGYQKFNQLLFTKPLWIIIMILMATLITIYHNLLKQNNLFKENNLLNKNPLKKNHWPYYEFWNKIFQGITIAGGVFLVLVNGIQWIYGGSIIQLWILEFYFCCCCWLWIL